MSTRKDPMDEVRQTLAKMKASGVTIHYSPAPGAPGNPGDRTMGIIHAEAKKLGMTYGDDDDSPGNAEGEK